MSDIAADLRAMRAQIDAILAQYEATPSPPAPTAPPVLIPTGPTGGDGLLQMPRFGIEGHFPAPDPSLSVAPPPIDGLQPYQVRRITTDAPRNPGRAAVEAAYAAKLLPVRWRRVDGMAATSPGLTGVYAYAPGFANGITEIMAGAGWRADIGFVTGQVARWLGDPDNDAAFADAATQADGALAIPWHVCNPALGLPALWNMPGSYRGLWCHPDHRADPRNIPIPWDIDGVVKPDTAHPPCAAAIMGLITGEPRWLWAGVAQGCWHLGYQVPGGRDASPVFDWNARHIWWGLRDLMLGWRCAQILQLAAHADALAKAIDGMRARINFLRSDPTCAAFGIFDTDVIAGEANFAPWQADMGVGVLGWAIGLGHVGFRPALDHASKGLALRTAAAKYAAERYDLHGVTVNRFPVGTGDPLEMMKAHIDAADRQGKGEIAGRTGHGHGDEAEAGADRSRRPLLRHGRACDQAADAAAARPAAAAGGGPAEAA